MQLRTHQSECRPSRTYSRPIPQQLVIRVANVSMSLRRSEPAAFCQFPRSPIGNFGLALFASADYARPLYRKDIFFPGSIKGLIRMSSATSAREILENPRDQVATSQTSIAAFPDGLRHRKTTIDEASVTGGDNPTDVNRTGSCLMSLTKIPLPDVCDKEGEVGEDTEAKIWDALKSKTSLNFTQEPADGIYPVPRSLSPCGWWLCWQTQREPSITSDDGTGKYPRSCASVVSRLSGSRIAGRSNVSTTILTAIALLICGPSACVMPYWGSLVGQILIMIVFGLTISPFFSLVSIIICDILDLEALTNADGIVTMIRGIASTTGSAVAGLIVSSRQTYSAALLIAGATIIIGGILYIIIIFYERANSRKKLKTETDAKEGRKIEINFDFKANVGSGSNEDCSVVTKRRLI
ncbi:hypothetical protein Aperf_G00000061570 [Anoplocephala perfoliata]